MEKLFFIIMIAALLVSGTVFVSNARATTQAQLTFGGYDWEPRFSPITDTIIFASENLFTIPVSGGSPTLFLAGGGNYAPAWFPDGQRVVYNNQNSGCELYVREADGSIRQLTFNEGRDDDPVVTPDAQWIYFVRNKFVDGEIWRIRVDGTQQQPVITGPGSQLTPSISFNGDALYYSSNESGTFQIWRANPDGSNRVQVTPEDGHYKFGPSLSPDGLRLVYTSDAAGTFPNPNDIGVYLCDANGTHQERLTANPPQLKACAFASWSPDGLKIVFGSGKGGDCYIYLLTDFSQPVATHTTNWGRIKSLYR